MNEAIEKEIQNKGKTAQRITPVDVENNIVMAHYFTADQGVSGACIDASNSSVTVRVSCPINLTLLTFCVLTLRNGFTVTGESACDSPENFDAEIGRKIARAKAVEKYGHSWATS